MTRPTGPVWNARLGEVLDFMRLIWALDHALQKTSKRMRSAIGVTGPQRLVVRIVARFPGIPAGQIAQLLHVHPSTLSGILKRLERQGLVRRRPDPEGSPAGLPGNHGEGQADRRRRGGNGGSGRGTGDLPGSAREARRREGGPDGPRRGPGRRG